MSEPRNRIVLRYERVTYHAVGAIEAHGKRLGDTKHVDASRTNLNEFPIGHADLRELVDAHIARMQHDNADLRRATLKRRRRRSELEDLEAALEAAGDDPHALAEVIGWPWDPKNVHPFTEGILSVSHEWFLDQQGQMDPAKIDTFRAFAVGYVESEFGGECLYARLDLDEKTPHLSFVIAPEHQERRTKRRMLSHRQHRLFGQEEVFTLFDDALSEAPADDKARRRSYELLQDRVADYARGQGLDLTRGEQRAQDERMKKELGEEVVKRRNVSPSRARDLGLVIAGESEESRLASEAAEKAARKEFGKAAAANDAADRASRAAADDQRRASDELAAAKDARKLAADSLEEVRAQEAALVAEKEAIMVGTQAILAEELTYAPPTSERPEALTWGPNRPDATRRSYLKEAIQPAKEWLISFAKRVQSLFDREAALDEAEADATRRARLVVLHEERAAREPPPSVTAIAETRPMELSEADFPDAWAFQSDATPEKVKEQVDAARNLELRAAFQATRDAVQLCDENTELQERFQRGLDIIEASAAERGFDLETGTQDTSKATNPELAAKHGDELPMPIRVVRRVLVRQRVRG